jgi:hypothetical protein
MGRSAGGRRKPQVGAAFRDKHDTICPPEDGVDTTSCEYFHKDWDQGLV